MYEHKNEVTLQSTTDSHQSNNYINMRTNNCKRIKIYFVA